MSMSAGVSQVSFLLLLCSVACGPAPSNAPATTASRPAGAHVPDSAHAIAGWLTADAPPAGCKATTAPQDFGPDNLWESIDGAADTYLAFGFQELSAASCAMAGGPEVAVEVYRMADALNAFGIYAQERAADVEVRAIGAEGYASRNIANFWSGPYYVKLRAATDAPAASAALTNLASGIAARIGPPAAMPVRLSALPAGGQVPRSIKYVPHDVLGQRYLSNAVEAQYDVGGKACRLLLVSLESAEQGADALARFKAFVGTAGRVTRTVSSPGEGGFAASSPLYGAVVAVRSAATLLIVVDAASEQAALHLITQALRPGGES